MEASKYIDGLRDIVAQFNARAKEHGEIVEATEIVVCRGYLLLDCTIEDEQGDCYRCSQEIEVDEDRFAPLHFNIG